MEDSKIIELFYERSEQAIVELSSKYERLCYKIAFNILKNDDDAKECINDAYLKVWNTIPPNRPENMLSYVSLVIRGIALDKLEFNMAKRRGGTVDMELEEMLNYIGESPSVDEIIDEKQFAKHMDEFLGSLDKMGRIIFVNRFYFCYSIHDIAASLKMTENNVTVKLSRIRSKLRKFLFEKGITV